MQIQPIHVLLVFGLLSVSSVLGHSTRVHTRRLAETGNPPRGSGVPASIIQPPQIPQSQLGPLYGNRTPGWLALGLLSQRITLADTGGSGSSSSSSFLDALGQPVRCDEATLSGAEFSSLALPQRPRDLTVVVELELMPSGSSAGQAAGAAAQPPTVSTGVASGTRPGELRELIRVGGLHVQWDISADRVILRDARNPESTIAVAAPTAAVGAAEQHVRLSISRRHSDAALAVCVDGSPARMLQRPSTVVPMTPGAPDGWLVGTALGATWTLEPVLPLLLATTSPPQELPPPGDEAVVVLGVIGSDGGGGDGSNTALPLTALVEQVWLVTAAWGCADAAAALLLSGPTAGPASEGATVSNHSSSANDLGRSSNTTGDGVADIVQQAAPSSAAAPSYTNSLPILAAWGVVPEGGGTGAAGEAFVGQRVQVAAAVTDADGDPLRLRLTFFGVPPSDCSTAECGNEVVTAEGAGGRVELSQSVVYELPGRYVVRLEASDGGGHVAAWDWAVLVRKTGDTQRLAPCCRSTGMVIAGQDGRPVHSTRFRDPAVARLAAGLGWSAAYLQGQEELESERLFDFGLLAPAHNPGGVRLRRCVDVFLAGPGSPRVLGGSERQRHITTGANKRMLIVPQGFSWGEAAAAADPTTAPACESHWSQWAGSSPYRRSVGAQPDGSPAYCSFACTRDGTQWLRSVAGLTDRLAEALAELSYGRLSFNAWRPVVTDTLLMPQNTSGYDAFSYSGAGLGEHLQRQLQQLVGQTATTATPSTSSSPSSSSSSSTSGLAASLSADTSLNGSGSAAAAATATAVAAAATPSAAAAAATAAALASGFHTTLVLSPQPPRSVNPGYTAWSAVGSGTAFVMRCAPQLYYMIHEIGHLLGLPHAGMWRLDNATQAPVDPAGPGGPVDDYSDKLDMMACCRGDFGALSRLWLGWLPYPERQHIPITTLQQPTAAAAPATPAAAPQPVGPTFPSATSGSSTTAAAGAATAAACSPASSPRGCSYSLWPLDRAESRGQLKALTLRLGAGEAVVLSYKSLAWWQDVRLGRDGSDVPGGGSGGGAAPPPPPPDRGSLTADESRLALGPGLSLEYMRLVTDPDTGRPSWTPRGLLDMNVFFGEWPAALPRTAGALPPEPAKSAFALLREGQAWIHTAGGGGGGGSSGSSSNSSGSAATAAGLWLLV